MDIQSVIDELYVFADLDQDTRRAITAVFEKIGKKESISPGTVIFQIDEERTDEGIVMLDGEASVVKPGVPEIVVFSPELIGEIAQLSPHGQRTATVSAMTDLSVLRFSWNTFQQEAAQTLSGDQMAKLKEAIDAHAWRHFSE